MSNNGILGFSLKGCSGGSILACLLITFTLFQNSFMFFLNICKFSLTLTLCFDPWWQMLSQNRGKRKLVVCIYPFDFPDDSEKWFLVSSSRNCTKEVIVSRTSVVKQIRCFSTLVFAYFLLILVDYIINWNSNLNNQNLEASLQKLECKSLQNNYCQMNWTTDTTNELFGWSISDKWTMLVPNRLRLHIQGLVWIYSSNLHANDINTVLAVDYA